MTNAEYTVLPRLVARRAQADPDRVFLRLVEGDSLSYGATHERALTWAAGFRQLGIGSYELVVVVQRPRPDGVAMWLGLGWLGAVETSVNTDYRGDMLAYVIRNAGARVLVVDAEFLPRIAEVAAEIPDATTVVVRGDAPAETVGHLRVVGSHALLAGVAPMTPDFRPEPWTTASVIYTSGTTGPSKGVIVPWAQIHATATGTFPPEGMGDDEVFYSPFTLFHMSGKLPPVVMALCGGTLLMRETLTLTGFWDEIKQYGCTATIFSKVATDLLMAAPPAPDDAELPLRRAVMGPVTPDHAEFSKRFGVELSTAFNMTEVSVPVSSGDTIDDPASCGRLREGYPYYEVRLVDDHDNEVPVGSVGEMIVRTGVPWTLNGGYHGYPEKTAEAWRNGWFHTGDAFRKDESGRYFFVDRFKDALRRRGENISSFEVELGVCAHPEVAECAVVAAPGGASGDEIKAVVIRTEGSALSAPELIDYLVPRMPRFMVPRYVEFVDELPKTPTFKVRKAELRADALNPRTWDRETSEHVPG